MGLPFATTTGRKSVSRAFQDEIRRLEIESSPSFVRSRKATAVPSDSFAFLRKTCCSRKPIRASKTCTTNTGWSSVTVIAYAQASSRAMRWMKIRSPRNPKSCLNNPSALHIPKNTIVPLIEHTDNRFVIFFLPRKRRSIRMVSILDTRSL